jgi:flagellin
MTVINSNSAAMLTANSINQNERMMTSTMERLSTGKRINSAADDAAGLAIATKMTAQVRGLDQAGRNANNATSMIQLADGSAEQISNILQRMREIVVQAADGSNSATDVSVLNVEFKEAASEIDRIVGATQFNGKNLLDGSAGGSTGDDSVMFQIGANANQTLSVEFGDFNLASGGGTGTASTGTITIANTAVAGYSGADVTLSDGTNSATLTAAQIVGAATTEGLALLIEQQNLNVTVSATADTSIVLTNANVGTHGAVTATTGLTVTEALGAAGGPMGADLGGYITTGMGTDYNTTLSQLDAAIEGVATQRATFGATMNRLEYAVDNLASSSLATATARGRIEDANYATETTSLARTQIIQQAGTAMLAQANQKAQSVLSLLQ